MCPALIVAAPSSGTGKTTITAAIARYHSKQGKKVTIFKVGPDFIDPMVLCQASGQLVYQLDLWLVGEAGCQQLLYKAARDSDLILIEGVMGLFDGTPSSADLAEYFNIPVLGIIDASAMAQTFAAVAFGLANYRPNMPFSGVIANRVNTPRHQEILQNCLPKDIKFYGRIPKDTGISLPQRHLGLVQAQELTDINEQLEQVASHIAETGLTALPDAVEFFASETANEKITGALKGTRIIIIKDKAFSFIYAANIAFLQEAGAELVYCSALNDSELPSGDVLYIPGGYPELFAAQLVANKAFILSLKRFAQSNKPIIAECGGMLYLLDQLTDMQQNNFQMLGLLPGKAVMQNKLAAIGSQYVEIPLKGTEALDNIVMRGHSFHYSSADIALDPISQTKHHPSERLGEYVYHHNNIIASYMHWYFPSNPKLSLRLFDKSQYQ